jgi:hypothetical protein
VALTVLLFFLWPGGLLPWLPLLSIFHSAPMNLQQLVDNAIEFPLNVHFVFSPQGKTIQAKSIYLSFGARPCRLSLATPSRNSLLRISFRLLI